jgi:hypothetical protein
MQVAQDIAVVLLESGVKATVRTLKLDANTIHAVGHCVDVERFGTVGSSPVSSFWRYKSSQMNTGE